MKTHTIVRKQVVDDYARSFSCSAMRKELDRRRMDRRVARAAATVLLDWLNLRDAMTRDFAMFLVVAAAYLGIAAIYAHFDGGTVYSIIAKP